MDEFKFQSAEKLTGGDVQPRDTNVTVGILCPLVDTGKHCWHRESFTIKTSKCFVTLLMTAPQVKPQSV